MKLREFANILGLSYSTALRMFKRGEIPGAYKLSTGTIVVPDYAPNLMTNDKIDLAEFFALIDKVAKQKLKESDYKHITDIISISSHYKENV